MSFSTEETAEAEYENVQESEREDSGLDTNILQASNERVHPVRGSMFSLTLMSKGEKIIWVPLLPSMPKGEIVGNV